MAVKFGVAFGAEVTVLSSSASKKEDAFKLGAHKFVVTKDADQVKAAGGYFCGGWESAARRRRADRCAQSRRGKAYRRPLVCAPSEAIGRRCPVCGPGCGAHGLQ